MRLEVKHLVNELGLRDVVQLVTALALGVPVVATAVDGLTITSA